jgi:Biotin-requiring enzyme
MPSALLVPRINNNDDKVRVVRFLVEPGGCVKRGEVVAEIETDKAVADIEAEREPGCSTQPRFWTWWSGMRQSSTCRSRKRRSTSTTWDR